VPIYRIALMYLFLSFQAFLYSISHLLIILIILMSYHGIKAQVSIQVLKIIEGVVVSTCFADRTDLVISYVLILLRLIFVPVLFLSDFRLLFGRICCLKNLLSCSLPPGFVSTVSLLSCLLP